MATRINDLGTNTQKVSDNLHVPVEYWLANRQISLHGDGQSHVDGGAQGHR